MWFFLCICICVCFSNISSTNSDRKVVVVVVVVVGLIRDFHSVSTDFFLINSKVMKIFLVLFLLLFFDT